MKSLLLVAALLVSVSGFSAHASSDEESHYCSSAIIFIDGSMRDPVRVECDSSFAGKCLSENPKAANGFDVVDQSVCDSQAEALQQKN